MDYGICGLLGISRIPITPLHTGGEPSFARRFSDTFGNTESIGYIRKVQKILILTDEAFHVAFEGWHRRVSKTAT
jgi:hypothetical protein